MAFLVCAGYATVGSLRAHARRSCLFAANTTHIYPILTILAAVLLLLYRHETLLFFESFGCKLSHISEGIVRLGEGRLSDLEMHIDRQET